MPWTFRVEPAFARAIDFVVGYKLANWTTTAGRSALQLTQEGERLFSELNRERDILTEEKDVLVRYAKPMTESLVTVVLGSGRKAA